MEKKRDIHGLLDRGCPVKVFGPVSVPASLLLPLRLLLLIPSQLGTSRNALPTARVATSMAKGTPQLKPPPLDQGTAVPRADAGQKAVSPLAHTVAGVKGISFRASGLEQPRA